MGIFTRLRDIVGSNINAMLEKAEDPEKLVKLMIQEMEDTLVEIKASCAGAMATKKRIQRSLDEAARRAGDWAGKAELAVSKGREDLAREALREKRRYQEQATSLEQEVAHCDELVTQYKEDIGQVEKKLGTAREKHRVLVQRHIHARGKKQAQQQIRRADSSDAFVRFDKFEQRIERMEADADLVNYGRKPSLEEEFVALEGDDEIEQELQELKDAAKKNAQA